MKHSAKRLSGGQTGMAQSGKTDRPYVASSNGPAEIRPRLSKAARRLARLRRSAG